MSSSLHARYSSVDAMRGVTVATMLVVNNPGDWNHVYAMLPHTMWDGCSIADLVFPIFLFLAGVSISLYVEAEQAKGTQDDVMHRRIMLRAAKLIVAGLALNVVMMWVFHLPHFFVMGTLQRIGICYMAAAWAAIHLRPRISWGIIAFLLFGYALLLRLGGSYAPFTNLSDRTDNLVLGVRAIISDPVTGAHRDPNGLLSTFGALATTLLGVRAGDWLRNDKTRQLCVAGLILLIIGFAWSYSLPINKKMWTSSFVLWTGGWGLLGLSIYHELIDRRGWPAIGRTLGVNAISAYIGSLLVFFMLYRLGWSSSIYRDMFASWLIPTYGPYFSSLCYAAAFTGMLWFVLKGMNKQGWYLRF